MSKWDAYSSADEDEQPKLKSSKNSFSDVSIEQKDEKPSKKIRTEDEVIGEVSMQSIMESKTDSIGREMSASSHETRSSVDAFTPATLTKIERPYNPIFDGCRSVECYQRLNFIDQGTYGMVFRAKCKVTNEVYALKQVKLGADANKLGYPVTALREINILLALQHPYIVKVKEVVVGSSIDKVYMVMEFCENDLKTCMKLSRQSFSTAEVKQLMFQLLSAIEHMHSKWYIHRDLKTANLLYNNKGYLSVCDFGLARKYGSPIAPYTAPVVTLWYRSPELLLGSRLYSTPIDMWSVGCIFAEMLTGEPLFPGEGEVDQIGKIFKVLGAPNEQRWPGFSTFPNVSKINWRVPTKSKLRELFPVTAFAGGVALNDNGMDLLSRMLNMDPAQRLSAKAALQHPWLCKEMPFPTPLDMMPKFNARHEQS